MPTYERLDYASDDGSQWGGASTDKIAFYGAVPIVQQSQVNVSSGSDTSTVVSTLIVVLKTIGLIV